MTRVTVVFVYMFLTIACIKTRRKRVGCLQFKRERANIWQEKQAQSCGDCGGSGTQAALTNKAECGAAAAACGCHRARIICCALAAVLGACARARVMGGGGTRKRFTALAATQGGATMV